MRPRKGVLDDQRAHADSWDLYAQRRWIRRWILSPVPAAILFIFLLIVTAVTEVQPFLLIMVIGAAVAGLRILLLINKRINHWHRPHKRKHKRKR